MYLPVFLALLCAGIICGQQGTWSDSEEIQMHLYCTNRDQRSTRGDQRLRQVIAGKAGPIGPPGIVDYTAVNGTIKQYVKEISGRKLSKVRLAIEGIRNLAGASDQTQRQVTQCSEDIEALKAEMKNLRTNLIKLIFPDVDLSTWFNATNGNYYKLFDDTANYATAKTNCERYGARLASAGIRDDDVRRELIPLLEAGRYDIWIGLNDIEQEGTYYWEDGVRADKNSTQWYENEPNDYKGNEDCVETAHYRNWKLNDDDCLLANKYLCEITI